MLEMYNSYRKAGKVLSDALDYALTLTKPGKRVLDIAEEVENRIRKKSGNPAFPLNISINEVAAHYSPVIEDKSTIPEKSIVKLDAGVEFNGYITDAARTIIFDDKWSKLKKSSEKALKKVLDQIKPGTSIYKVGEIAEKVIKKDSFKVITNLNGHSLARYSLHDGVSIPNYSVAKRLRKKSHVFSPNKAYAIEPFATTGGGRVYNENQMTIYRQFREWNLDTLPDETKEIYDYIKNNFLQLPFSWRWLYNQGFSNHQIKIAKKVLLEKQIIHGYPILVEVKKKPVSQSEETIFVEKEKIIVLTKNS